MAQAVVIGAGVFGTWTAWYLHEAGHAVTLVEAYEPGHSRSSSGDESRIVRCGYGADEVYSRFALRSLHVWREWAAASPMPDEPPLFHRCGVLWLSSGDDAYVRDTRRTLDIGGYGVQALDAAALATSYPQLDVQGISLALLEPECGVVMARRAVAALARQLQQRGVRMVRRRISTIGEAEELGGDTFVFACGPWLPKVFPALEGIVRPTRQVVMYFGTPAGDDRFGPARLPAWVDFASGVYGVPDLEGRGLKVGIDRHGAPFDPETSDRVLDAESIEVARAWLARRLPDMASAPLVEGRVCQYENTSSGDFLIDRHPDRSNVWIVGGGSGHGFKHGPAVGEYVAALIDRLGEPEPRFSLAAKATVPGRTVF